MKAYGDIEVNLLSIWEPHGYVFMVTFTRCCFTCVDTEISHIAPIGWRGEIVSNVGELDLCHSVLGPVKE
jgi:hypothetical protein